MKLGRRRARGAKDDGGLARRFAQADGEERAASLVDMNEDLDARVPLKRHREGGRARAWRHARELHALRGELVDECRGEALRYIHTIEL